MSKVTIPVLKEKKANGEKITMLTAYDYPTARILDQAGIDILLVGDTLGMVILGYPNTQLLPTQTPSAPKNCPVPSKFLSTIIRFA